MQNLLCVLGCILSLILISIQIFWTVDAMDAKFCLKGNSWIAVAVADLCLRDVAGNFPAEETDSNEALDIPIDFLVRPWYVGFRFPRISRIFCFGRHQPATLLRNRWSSCWVECSHADSNVSEKHDVWYSLQGNSGLSSSNRAIILGSKGKEDLMYESIIWAARLPKSHDLVPGDHYKRTWVFWRAGW